MSRQIYGLIGHPVGHSLSPAMHNEAFKTLGIDAEYLLYDIAPEALDDFFKSAANKGIAGFNVTIPHKIAAKNFIEKNGKLDDNARKLGAVNTVKVSSEGLCGYNTDGPGFYRSLVEDLKFEPEGKRVLVLGAGGAASAVAMYLGKGPKSISVFDVDNKKVEDLKKHFEKNYGEGKFEVVGEDSLKKVLGASDLLVNATPIGMKESDPSPVSKDILHTGLYVYDLVYNRPYTALVKDANSIKCHATTGLGMLLYQGAVAFEIWTGKPAPVAVMRRALKSALANKG